MEENLCEVSTDGKEEKVQRLPKSLKKKLKFERIRQQRREKAKQKKKLKKISPNSKDEEKFDRNLAKERLKTINDDVESTTICLDCSFNDLMSEKELSSLARQIGRCYSSNRRSEKPVRFCLTNWSTESRLAAQCRRVNAGFDSFPIVFQSETVDEIFPQERLVYLSPNGEELLTEIDDKKAYVIGGLVDESVRKNETLSLCEKKQIRSFRLPIELFMKHSEQGGSFNQILSINQVFDILLCCLSTKDWREALRKNVPERKGWVLKETSSVEQNQTIED